MFEWSNRERCLEYVNHCGLLIEFVENQTEEICIAAIIQSVYSLNYIKKENITREMCMIAIEQDKNAIQLIPVEFKDIHDAWEIMYG